MRTQRELRAPWRIRVERLSRERIVRVGFSFFNVRTHAFFRKS